MKNRYFRIPILLTCMVMAILVLSAGMASAEEQYTEFLGKPFPEFTATDTEGNTFTLSEALNDHEAVLINLWATWCTPCRREFPFLNELYKKYGDRVAFIALSTEENDTIEKIAEYRKENGIPFPMGRDEGNELYRYIHANGIPDTVIVDRFGNAVFCQDSAFRSAGDAERALETFLGDGYTQSAVLEKIPRDASTQAYPVSAARALYPDSESCRKVLIHAENLQTPIVCWVIPDESVTMVAEVAADDDVSVVMYGDAYSGDSVYIADILDPETGVYAYKQLMPQPEEQLAFIQVGLFNGDADTFTEKDIVLFLVKDEDGIEYVADALKGTGYEGVSWEYADASDPAENALQAYIIHVVDQDNQPVEEVTVNFCTDTACIPNESDENGLITFTGAPDVYHVQIVDGPEGYSWDEDYEMYTTREYSEWVLRVRKD